MPQLLSVGEQIAPIKERTRQHPRPADWDGLASLYSKLPGADRSWCRALGRIDAERS